MRHGILVINAGSSSIKFSVYVGKPGEQQTPLSSGQIEGIGTDPHFIAKDNQGNLLAEKRWEGETPGHEPLLRHLIHWIESHLPDGVDLVAAGHRVVHGGPSFSEPVRVTEEVIAELERFVPLAPLHQPHNLSPMKALAKEHPDLPQVACFDTAFHRTMPRVAEIYGLPRELTDEGVIRYGFHGLSYEYIASALPEVTGGLPSRAVVCHLGSGASMCAIRDGKSVASTLGFTAVEGLPMGTRTGQLDPGVVLYLMQQKGMDAKQIETLLYKQSGLKGISQISNDMRDLIESDDYRAAEAVDYFCYRINRELGSLVAALDGLDALVFTAGIGERSAEVRERVCRQAGWAGIELESKANQQGATRISTDDSRVPVWVVPTDEERMIARHTRQLLGVRDMAEA